VARDRGDRVCVARDDDVVHADALGGHELSGDHTVRTGKNNRADCVPFGSTRQQRIPATGLVHELSAATEADSSAPCVSEGEHGQRLVGPEG
jgi:hypothetical protein